MWTDCPRCTRHYHSVSALGLTDFGKTKISTISVEIWNHNSKNTHWTEEELEILVLIENGLVLEADFPFGLEDNGLFVKVVK